MRLKIAGSKVRRYGLNITIGVMLIVAAGHYLNAVRANEMPSFQAFLKPDSNEVAGGKPMIIDMAGLGFLKQMISPWKIRVSGNVIANVGNQPARLKFSLTEDPLPVAWSSRQLSWDDSTKSITRPIMPHEHLSHSLSLYIQIPEKYRDRAMIYSGGLKISDGDTDRTLAFIPLKLINSDIASGGMHADTQMNQQHDEHGHLGYDEKARTR